MRSIDLIWIQEGFLKDRLRQGFLMQQMEIQASFRSVYLKEWCSSYGIGEFGG